MSSVDAFIEVRDATFCYGEKVVLQNINLRIPKGSVVAIMGGSGCGKTSLLRLLNGQRKPQSGDVLINGQSLIASSNNDLYALRHKMGMLFQHGALFTDLTVFENVAFQMREQTQLTEEIIHDLVYMKLHAVGLHGIGDMMTSELSGGMARRVALARSIALDPEIIMYDEPFAGLDPISLAVIGQLIRKFNDALGATSIMVTHDIQESLAIVDYVYFIEAGRIIAEGTPADINNSSSPYVKQFINGEVDGPVNFHYSDLDYPELLLEPNS